MILIIDNYDSFTYNLAQALGAMGRAVKVVRNDAVGVNALAAMEPEALVISPGPGRPEDAGISCAAIERMAGRVPILGVCLGHQAIGAVFGARVERAARPMHGKTSEVFHSGKGIFRGLRNPMKAARYHSLIVPEASVPARLAVSAYTTEGEVMGLSAPGMMIEGVQFHPESIATGQGELLLRNFLARAEGFSAGERSAA